MIIKRRGSDSEVYKQALGEKFNLEGIIPLWNSLLQHKKGEKTGGYGAITTLKGDKWSRYKKKNSPRNIKLRALHVKVSYMITSSSETTFW